MKQRTFHFIIGFFFVIGVLQVSVMIGRLAFKVHGSTSFRTKSPEIQPLIIYQCPCTKPAEPATGKIEWEENIIQL